MLFAIPALRANRVNLLMNDHAAGLPSPLAFLGLGAAIAPDLGAPRWSVAVLPVLHEVHVSEGRTKPEMAPNRSSGVFAPIEVPEDMIGTVCVSLLMDVPGCSDEHQVSKMLRGRRIAGGTVENSEIKTIPVAPDGSAFRQLRRGYAMIRGSTHAAIAGSDIEDLKAFAADLYPTERRPGSGWHVPVAVGHKLLENPATAPKRANTRNPNIPHVFTEPVVGIAELVSVRNPRLTDLDQDGMRDLLWRWTAAGRWITGHPNYHPDCCAAANKEDVHAESQD